MTLYSANVLDVAKPIEKKKKQKVSKAENSLPAEPVADTAPAAPAINEKRMAALQKAQETRKRKREEALAAKKAEDDAIAAKEAEIKAKEEEILRKKEEAKEKRRKAREAKQEASPPTTEESPSVGNLDEAPAMVKEKKRRVVKEKNPTDPPEWFKKYVEGVKKEEAKVSIEKRPVKIVQEEARQVAASQWNDGLTRDRVQNEVDGHMSRMYGMIFGTRRMK